MGRSLECSVAIYRDGENFSYSDIVLQFGDMILGLALTLLSQNILPHSWPSDCIRHSNLVLSGSATDRFVGYLEELVATHALSPLELERFSHELLNGKITNPISEEDAELSPQKLIHAQGIEKYLRRHDLDREGLLKWVKKTLERNSSETVRRDKTQKESSETLNRPEFQPVLPGSFELSDSHESVSVTLTHKIEVMKNLVTQYQWVELMGENPSNFKSGAYSASMVINGKTHVLQPDLPIANITWWSAIEFANRLSIKHGLKPAYDLTGLTPMSFPGMPALTAENGMLSTSGFSVKINAPNGNIYEAEGYRLPTEAEIAYLFSLSGQSRSIYPFGDSIDEASKFAWSKSNSDGSPHPVGQLAPLIINGQEYFDLVGNVQIWGHDDFSRLTGGTDPVNPRREGGSRVVRGGSWSSNSDFLQSTHRDVMSPNVRQEYVGIRLVRTIIKKE